MFKRFAQWCEFTSGGHTPTLPGGSHFKISCPSSDDDPGPHRQLAALLLPAMLLVTTMTDADVGLPAYDGPIPELVEAEQAHAPQMVVKQISHQSSEIDAPRSCEEATRMTDSALDFAPPADQRVQGWDTLESAAGAVSAEVQAAHADIPVYIKGSTAAMRTGRAVSAIDAITIQGRTLLVSYGKDYFNRLQAIRPRDKLLVQTEQTLRQYQVTRARITQAGTEAEDPAPDTLMLAACYPFQPVGSAPLLYIVDAQPFPAVLPDHSATEEGGSYETVSF